MIVIFIGCSDEIDFSDEILNQLDWLKIFVIENDDFKGGKYNIDTNIFDFSFKTHLSVNEYFKKLDLVCKQNDWIMTDSLNTYRIFEKGLYLYASKEVVTIEVVKIRYDDKEKRIVVNVRSKYK